MGLLVGLATAPVRAQGAGEPSRAGAGSNWTFQFTPYFWLTRVDGDTQLGPLQSDVHADLSDILNEFNVWGVMGRLEARRDRLTLFLDVLHTSVDQRETFSRGGPLAVRADADFELSTVELGAAYMLFDHRFDGGPGRLRVEALGGGRHTHFEQTLGATGLGPLGITGRLGGTADWVDPFVGGRVRLDLTDRLAIHAYADVGGFDVGDAELSWKLRALLDWRVSAELSWKLRALLDWRVSPNVSLLGGYQVYGLDFEEGRGRGRIGFDGEFYGPIFGLGLRF